ncbi:uncharacterized protein Gyg [Venturia canescens]|uniref:uncharacterized protein Gyg n=1 Tax=Venturia canescens TaxID=32260 RepID=UPI001C9C21F8|nr:uncharacterized protein LOC122416576 [Venturia canescens]
MGGFAWVTLATNDSYSLGALVLAHSLRRVGTKHDLAVLVTPGVTGAMREKLSSVFSLVQEVNVLDSKDETNLALLARPELGITFTKLHCWRLTQYEKCVFVDADTLVIRNCDELFEREELSAAPDVGWPDCFNSGVFVFKPSQETFASLTSFAAAKGSFDGGDQGLLNQYFSDWAHKDISKHLPFIYNMCSTATYSYLPAFKQFGDDVRIIHFIGITKPWLQYFDTVTSQVQPAPGSHHLLPLLQLWWNIFCDSVHPQLSPVMLSNEQRDSNSSYREASSTLAQHWHEHKSPSVRSHYPMTTSDCDTAIIADEKIQNAVPDFSEFRDPWNNYHSADESAAKFTNNNDRVDYENDQENVENFSQPSDSGQFIVETSNILPSHDFRSNFRQENHQNSAVLERFENRVIQDNVTRHTPQNHYFHNCEKNDELRVEECHTFDDKFCRERDIEKENDAESCKNLNDSSTSRESCDVANLSESRETLNLGEAHPPNVHRFHFYIDENQPESEKKNHFCRDRPSENECTEVTRQERRVSDTDTEQADSDPSPSCPTYALPCTKPNNVTTQSESNNSSQLESNDAGIAGALAKITLGEARSPEQVAFEEHMRKQSWEQGQIDYMGRDSFANIWKKISETLSAQPEREPSPPKAVPKSEKAEIEGETSAVSRGEETAPTKNEAGTCPQFPFVRAQPFSCLRFEQRRATNRRHSIAASCNVVLLDWAVLAELERTYEKDDLLGEIARELKELVSPLTDSMREGTSESTILTEAPPSEAAAAAASSPLAPLPEILSTAEAIESIAAPSCTLEIPEGSSFDCKFVGEGNLSQAPSGGLENPEKVDESREKTANIEILSESQVPIQVAESVLEADVEESVSEDLKPVTEEAFSSISQTAQESVPAVLETAMEAVDSIAPRSNGSVNLASEIGNGIDALCTPANRLASATMAVVERASDLYQPVQSQDSTSPIILPAEPTNAGENVPSQIAQPTSSLPQSTQLLEKPNDDPAESIERAETLRDLSVLAQATEVSAKRLTGDQVSTEAPVDSTMSSATPQTASIPTEKYEESPESLSSAGSSIEAAKVAKPSSKTEESEVFTSSKVDEPKSPELAPTKIDSTTCPMKSAKKMQEFSEKAEKSEIPKDSRAPSSPSVPEQSLSDSTDKEVSQKPPEKEEGKLKKSIRKEDRKVPDDKKDSVSAAEELTEKSTSKKSTKEPTAKKVVKSLVDKDVLKVTIVKKEIPEDTAEKEVREEETVEKSDEKKSIESSTDESSPVRPARTKELQIPDTPTIIEATPPTSPPIGGAESLEEQQQQQQASKVTKKTVKKVVKKTSEAKPADGNEAETEGKKVTKKIVKKVVKKKDEDGNSPADATGVTEKPKKIVKVVKKTTTTKTASQMLDAEAPVPETPPPGTPDVPVPPKRKIKTTTKTSVFKSDSEQ